MLPTDICLRCTIALLEISVMEEQKSNERQHIIVEAHIISDLVSENSLRLLVQVLIPEEPTQEAQSEENEDKLEGARLFSKVIGFVSHACLRRLLPSSHEVR